MELLFLLIIAVAFIAYRLNKSKIKGSIGEFKVARILDRLNDAEFKVMNNVLIRTTSGLSQIDQIVISIYGIFVIETKNYSGWIHGNENSEYWTQSIYKKKSKFRNPIKQNWAHIYALKEVLSDFKQIAYHPIIVFAGSAELKNVSSKIPVVYKHQLFQVLMDKKNNINLSVEQINSIVEKLNKLHITDKQIKKDHIHVIKNNAYELRQKEKSFICPRCGSELVSRKGPYGNFYGCLNYPKCKYTRRYKI